LKVESKAPISTSLRKSIHLEERTANDAAGLWEAMRYKLA